MFDLPISYYCQLRKKVDKENSVRINLVFDTIIAYPNDSIWTSFHLDINPYDPSYIIDWSSPVDFTNNSIYHVSLISDSTLKFILKNSAGKKLVSFASTILIDTILMNPKYDFRNSYEGDYLFKIHHLHFWMDPHGLDTTYFVNGYVKKAGFLKSSLLEINYGSGKIWGSLAENSALLISLDNTLSYLGLLAINEPEMFRPYVRGHFFDSDSLTLTIAYNGPMGISDSRYVNAKKIKSLASIKTQNLQNEIRIIRN